MPRFVDTGRGRVARAMRALEGHLEAGPPELHALAGEAAVLELFEVATLAREAEGAVRRALSAEPASQAEAEAKDACLRALGRIAAALEVLAPPR